MLFGYEMKKVWRRVSPLLVLIVLLVTAVATVAVTKIFFDNKPVENPDVNAEYAALSTKIAGWNDNVNRNAIADAFDKFYLAYKEMNASTLNGKNLVQNYNKAGELFQKFYADYYQKYIYKQTASKVENKIADYLLVQEKYINDFNQIMELFDKFFTDGHQSGDAIKRGLKYTNTNWGDADLQNILDNLFFVQTIDDDTLNDLKDFFKKHPADQGGYDQNTAYEYTLNRFWVSVATHSDYRGKLSDYWGFDEYSDVATSTRAYTLANYRLENAEDNFATPFAFGKIYNQGNQVSLFDFVFTNLEMAMIPVALLVMIWAACTFFTDNYQKTLITPVAVGKKRSTIIVTKMLVVMVLAAAALLILTGVYLTCGLLLFRAYISPDILFLLNGTKPMVMSAINYFAIYILNLVFKLLPLIAVCGLFSFTKTKPFVIVGFTILIYAAVMLLNLCLGGFGFYQFVPLMGLDPIRYFGAELLFAPMPSSYNIWYTFPVMLAITVILYLALIRKFRHHDF